MTTNVNKNTIIVTRHHDLILLLERWGLVTPDTTRIDHTDNIEDVLNKDVIGVIPAKLAIFANTVTEVPLAIPRSYTIKNKETKDIPIDDLEKMASAPQTYKVREVDLRTDFSESILYSRATTFIQYVIREGIIPRRGQQHLDYIKREGATIPIEEVKNKSIIGHLPYHISQYAKDVTSLALYYEYDRRGKVHTHEEMLKYNPKLFTYTVEKIS